MSIIRRALGLSIAIMSLVYAPVLKAEPVFATNSIYDKTLKKIIGEIQKFPEFVSLIEQQNEKSKAWDEGKILAFDKRWRSDDRSLIDPILQNSLSKKLAGIVASSNGLVAEVIVMGHKGCNVAVSSKTTDYWQGDESKWKKTFGARSADVFADTVKFDESTGVYSQQLSATIFRDKKPIGAITIGFDVRFRPGS